MGVEKIVIGIGKTLYESKSAVSKPIIRTAKSFMKETSLAGQKIAGKAASVTDEFIHASAPESGAIINPIKQLSLEEKMLMLADKVKKISPEDMADPFLRKNIDFALTAIKEDIRYHQILSALKMRDYSLSPELFSVLREYYPTLLNRFLLKGYPIDVIKKAYYEQKGMKQILGLTGKISTQSTDKKHVLDCLSWYQAATANSGEVNNALRLGQTLTQRAQKVVNCFDSIQRPLGINRALIRATNDFPNIKYSSLKVGEEFVDKGYVSTMKMTGMDNIEEFASTYKHFLIIKTPANKKVIIPADWTQKDSMTEIILPRNTRFRVVSNEPLKDFGTPFRPGVPDRRLITLEIVE